MESTGTEATPGQSVAEGPAKRSRIVTLVATAVVAILLVVLVSVIIGGAVGYKDKMGDESALLDKNAYQTVFLTNGQVYFGKIKEIKSDYFQLTDIFYLQVQQSVQPSGDKSTTTTQPPAANDASQTQLVKLGDELHAPQDSMQINRDQVQFWENIKADGKVAQAIASYKK